jgi:hypothetical protein
MEIGKKLLENGKKTHAWTMAGAIIGVLALLLYMGKSKASSTTSTGSTSSGGTGSTGSGSGGSGGSGGGTVGVPTPPTSIHFTINSDNTNSLLQTRSGSGGSGGSGGLSFGPISIGGGGYSQSTYNNVNNQMWGDKYVADVSINNATPSYLDQMLKWITQQQGTYSQRQQGSLDRTNGATKTQTGNVAASMTSSTF